MNKTNQISCEIVKDLLPGYLEHLLSDASAKAVEEHLFYCENCRHTMKGMEQEVLHPEPMPEEKKALEGFQKIHKHTRHLKLWAGSLSFLFIIAVLVLIFKLFIIGKPADATSLDNVTCTYDHTTDSLTIEGHAANLNISKVWYEPGRQEDTALHIFINEAESLPFLSETHDISITIPEAKGKDIYLTSLDYDKICIYSWRDDHYTLVEGKRENIYQTFSSLNPETDILSCQPGIELKDGKEGLLFTLNYLSKEHTFCWFIDQHITTDGELNPSGMEFWVSLEEPSKILIYDYQNGIWTEDGSIIEERRPGAESSARPLYEFLI